MPTRKPSTVYALLNLFRSHLDARVCAHTTPLAARPGLRPLAPSSRAEMVKRIERARILFNTRLDELGPQHLDPWLLSMKPGNARAAASTVRQAFLWGREKGYVIGDPTAALMRARTPHKRGEPLTREQLRAFIAECVREARDRGAARAHVGRLSVARNTASADALQFIAITGARSGAVGYALDGDFDEASRTLRVQTKGRVRTLALQRASLTILKKRRSLVGGLHGYLFPGMMQVGLDCRALNQAFKRIARNAGLPANHHENDLRHTAITLLRRSGATWLEAAEFALHDDPRTTKKTYDHTDVTPTSFALADRYVAFLGVDDV